METLEKQSESLDAPQAPGVEGADFSSSRQQSSAEAHVGGTPLEKQTDGGTDGARVLPLRRLRILTVVAPIAYLIVVEILSLLILNPLLGNREALRLFVIFLLIVAGAVPFSLWIFSTIERQQRSLAASAAVLDSVHDYAIFMVDAGGNILTWNPGAERVKGYRADEVIGRHFSQFYTPEDQAAGVPAANLQKAAAGGRFEAQGWRVRKDGSRYWADATSTAVKDEAGAVVGFTQVVRDITERREAEARIRKLNDELGQRILELREANAEIVRRNRQLAAINTAIVSVSSALDLGEVLQNIVDAARGLVHSRYGALGVADEHGHILQFITSGLSHQEREAIGPLPQGHGLLGALIKEGTPLRIPAIGSDPRSYGFPPNHPSMTSLLGVPILFNEKPVGDLYLTDKLSAEEFTDEDQELVMLLANHAAVAIENARLYEEVRTARDRFQVWNEDLERRVEERTREIERYSKTLTTRVLQAQEEERKRIARELHDDTAQSLSTLLINLDVIDPHIGAENETLRTGFQRVREIAQRTLDATRALSHDLRPTILDDFGLVAALRWFADEFMRTFGVAVELHTEPPNGQLTLEIELVLFRITQEALTNSGKYAEANHTGVQLSFPDGTAKLVVEDDGKGFEPATRRGPTRQGGLGLYGMHERAELVGGILEVESAPGQGTRVTAIIPVAAEPAMVGHEGSLGNETC